ncbi:MAG: SDR family NAD(P)-dependent oxidoreductase [Chloroflexi bacterium]|nr:SDR family NAD(P)-dependent oxidoreductase [Chloroflexota bacterium]MCI0768732.1 SDR family NAD(P)-dependent oxidoreductase [Chloroflexota bacterium]
MPSFQGKVALVTGASRGIGKAIAIALGREGADVVTVARASDANPLKLPGTVDETARRIEAAGAKALAVSADLTRDEEIQRAAETALEAFGRVDILINNAAIDFPAPLLELPVKRYDLIMALDLRAPYLLARHLLPSMLERGGGSILNVSSLAALNQYPGQLPYGMAKAALERFTWGLAEEMKDRNIVSNCLRVDVPIASEGFVMNFADRIEDKSTWEKTDVGAEAALWMLQRDPATFNGVNIGITGLREQYGIPAFQKWEPGEAS